MATMKFWYVTRLLVTHNCVAKRQVYKGCVKVKCFSD